jgi:hypothetical protein
MMEDTYTYTARSALNPERVVTFTLYDHHMSVEVGAPLEQMERIIESRAEEEETAEAEPAQPWIKPVAAALVERGLRPFDVTDVDAEAENGGLEVRAWVRSGGLRVAPITFAMDAVDNPDATRAFVKELDHRKQSATAVSPMPGFLDYWAGWLLISSLLFLSAWMWRRKRETE